MTATVALVNGSARTDGTRFDAQAYRWALDEIGYQVTWYQCMDYGRDNDLPEMDRSVPGLGIPQETLDMGVNRLWTFPRRLRHIPESIVLLMDPTLVSTARFHSRSVVRLQDLRPLSKFADRYATTWMYRYAIPRLRTVQRVLVPTPTMQQELCGLKVPDSAVRVVPQMHLFGRHPDHISKSVRRIRERGSIEVLYIAQDRPYKNVGFVVQLAQACAKLRGQFQLNFTIVSRLGPESQALVDRLSLPNLKILHDLPEMSELYDASDVLVYPSSYEGFGRPIIEAMAFGLPILSNRVEPLSSIVSDAGFLLDITELDSWVGALRALEETSLFEDYANRSLARSDAYSPASFRNAVAAAFDGL